MKNLTLITLIVALAACQKYEVEEPITQAPSQVAKEITGLQVPSAFNFETVEDINTAIAVNDLNDDPISGVRIDFYTKDPLLGGEVFASGFTNDQGTLNAYLQIPTYLDEIYVHCNFKGFANSVIVPANQTIVASFGGRPQPRNFTKNKGKTTNGPIHAGGNVYYMGTYSNLGLPNYLENPGDVLSTSFLDDINSSLPSNSSVPLNNPQYLANSNEFEIVVESLSDVWVTFVTEGAGYRNSLAYYVYDTGNPPTSAAQIDSVFVIFPNASLKYSGGELYPGDKVHLGRFPAGKSISWILFQNAYKQSTNDININAQRIYSKKEFNPEANLSDKQHNVQLTDNGRQLLLNGFEDILRDQPGCDHDFEDMIFYVTANPWTGIVTNNSPAVTPAIDSDNDGVNDQVDDYPNDFERALDVDFTGSLGFEDLWPATGDYDFNDMVLSYDITHVLNGSNEVVELDAAWTLRAIGASFNNGFGWQFENISPSEVATVTRQNALTSDITTDPNGVESGQTKATVIVFDKAFNELRHAGGMFINTVKSEPTVAPVTLDFQVSFATPQTANKVGLPPYNSFIFTDNDRTKEVHLPDHEPTDLVNWTIMNTYDDDSDNATGRYYKTKNNLPWAIHIYGNYEYPIEYAPINNAYLYFSQWAQSGGTVSEDWYLDQTGYRNNSKIF